MADKKDDLGFVYLAEQVSPEDNPVKNLRYDDKASVIFAEFDTILQTFRCMNRNHRCYLGQNLNEMLQAERVQSMLSTNAWYGEMDHPQEMYENVKLTPQRVQMIYMPNRSHKIMKPVVNGDVMTAKIQTASGTEAGRGMALEIIQGLIPSFSCRAIATLQNINGKPTVIVRKLITYDWVLYPSHKEAMMQGASSMIQKSIPTQIQESARDNVFTALKRFGGKYTTDVEVPLTQLLENVGETDPNLQTVLESFNLDETSILGFDPSMTHTMVRDEDNTLYVKMSPHTRREVRDFLSSF